MGLTDIYKPIENDLNQAIDRIKYLLDVSWGVFNNKRLFKNEGH